MMYLDQRELEKKFSKEYAREKLCDYFTDQGDEQFELLITVVEQFMSKEHDYKPIEEFNKGIRDKWQEEDRSIRFVVSAILTEVAVMQETTLQAIVSQTIWVVGEPDYYKESCRLVGQILSIMDASGFITIHPATKFKELRMITLGYELPKVLAHAIGNCAFIPPALMPMRPNSNSDAGWITFKKSIFLGNHNHHNGNAPLHWLDSLNSTAFSIDLHMLNYDEDIKPEIQKNPKKLRAFQRRRDITIRSIKEMLAHGNRFYFIHRFCSRYRAYASGYALSIQGNDYRKALISLHKKELLTDTYNF